MTIHQLVLSLSSDCLGVSIPGNSHHSFVAAGELTLYCHTMAPFELN